MAAAAAASTTAALSLAVRVIVMIVAMIMPAASTATFSLVLMIMPVTSTAAFSVVSVIVAMSMAAAASAALVIMAVAAAAALRLGLIDGELDFLKGQLLANTHNQVRRAVIRQVGRAELNFHLFIPELRKGLHHLAVEDEGEVGIHLVLKLGQLLFSAGPFAGFVHGEYDLVRVGIESHGVEHGGIFKSGHKLVR